MSIILAFPLKRLIKHYSYHLLCLSNVAHQLDSALQEIITAVRNKRFQGYDYIFNSFFVCDHLCMSVTRSRHDLFLNTLFEIDYLEIRLATHLNSGFSDEVEKTTLEPLLRRFHVLTLDIHNYMDCLQNIIPLLTLLERRYLWTKYDIKVFDYIKSVLQSSQLNLIKKLVLRTLDLYRAFAGNNDALFKPHVNLPPLHVVKRKDIINIISATSAWLKSNEGNSRQVMPYHSNVFNSTRLQHYGV